MLSEKDMQQEPNKSLYQYECPGCGEIYWSIRRHTDFVVGKEEFPLLFNSDDLLKIDCDHCEKNICSGGS